MERERDRTDLVELGIASTDTHGEPIGWPPEVSGYFVLGLSDE